MAYATKQDIIDRYGENYLTDAADRNDDDQADDTPVTNALDDAFTEMNSFIGVKYPLPLATTPGWLKLANIDIAIYELASENRGSLTKEITMKYERWIERLGKLACGKVLLGLDDEPSTHYEQAISSDTPLMHPNSTEGLF